MSKYAQLTALGIELKKNSGKVKVKCPKCSHSRKKKTDPCLSVDIDQGVYNCFNCGWSGGVFEKRTQVAYTRPTWTNSTQLSEKAVKWFNGRGISQQTLIRMKVSEGVEFMPQTGKPENTIQFNYFREDQLINVKYRDGRKNFKMVSGAEKILYNINSIKDCAVVCEGEMDALSFIEAGINHAVSVPNGANKNLDYLTNCWDQIEAIEKFYIAVDNDAAGHILRDELIRRFGEEKCFVVDFEDCKDANQYLQKHGKIKLASLLETSKPTKLSGIIYVESKKKSVHEFYENGLPQGCGIGVPEMDRHLTYVGGYTTGFTGIPTHGKSNVVDFIVTRLAIMHDWKFAVYSPENFPEELHISQWLEKIIGLSFRSQDVPYNRMNYGQMDSALDFINNHFFFINPEDEDFSLESILSHTRKLVGRYGVNGLIIDPWNRLEHQKPAGMSDTDYIGKCLDRIDQFNKQNRVHTFLVAHPRKVNKRKDEPMKYEIPTLYDINGSANWYNKLSNGVTVYRNFGETPEQSSTHIYFQKVKFRHWGELGVCEMNYDPLNGRFNPVSKQFDRESWIEVPRQSALTQNEDFLTEVTHSNNEEYPF